MLHQKTKWGAGFPLHKFMYKPIAVPVKEPEISVTGQQV